MVHISRQAYAITNNASKEGSLSRVYNVLKPHLDECRNLQKPKNASRMRNNVWHVQSTKDGDVMIYSAFYDDRECFKGKTFVRLLAVTNIVPKENLFCQVWYADMTNALISPAVSDDTGRGLRVKSVKYQERLYSCEIPRLPSVYPTHVSLSDNKCAKSSINVPVVVPPKEQVHDVGVCVVVAYGDINPVQLVEWFELNRILGISEFNVYDSNVGAATKQVFQYYERQQLLVRHAAAPSVDSWCKWCQKLTAIASLNDCMYRNMYRYKHMAVIDFDEFIIPAGGKGGSVKDVIARVRGTWQAEPPAYMFRNAYFFLDNKPELKTPPYLVTSRFTSRQNVSAVGYAPKSIVNPRRCLVMQNHYCMKRTPDVSGAAFLTVKPQYALSHHYKLCHFKKDECAKLVKSTVRDTSALPYAEALNEAVVGALVQLRLIKIDINGTVVMKSAKPPA